MRAVRVGGAAVLALAVPVAVGGTVGGDAGVEAAVLQRAATDAQTAPPEGLRPADLHRLRSVEDVALSPGGERVAFTVAEREADGRPETSLWIRDRRSGEERRVGRDVSDPTWSPGGDRLAFIGRREGDRGLFVASDDGATVDFVTATRWTNRPLPSTGRRLAWSPDGTRIAYVSATDARRGGAGTRDPRVISRYLYKPTASVGDTRFADFRQLDLFVAELDRDRVRRLTEGGFDEHSIDWSPDGERILFLSNREPNPGRFFNYDVFVFSLPDEEVRRLIATESVEYAPVWSPGGGRIAYQGTRRGLTSSETTMEDTHVWVMDADGTHRREVGAGIDNRQGAPRFSHDGRWLYFSVREDGNVHLHRVSVEGGRQERVVGGRGKLRAWSLSDSGAVAYAFAGPRNTSQLFLSEPGRPDRPLTRFNQRLLESRGIARVDSLIFESFDGLEVEAYLTRPLAMEAGGKHPLIVMVKGGPHSQQGADFDYRAQVYAARGWAVLMINYRGSVGYGQDFADAIFGDQNGGEALDVLYGTRAAIRRNPWVDRSRIGIEGGSYGGQLTNWLVTQTDLFAAAIPIAGISNLVSFNYMAYYHDYLAVEYGARPHQGQIMDRLWERSPLRYVAQVSTPVMLVHGEHDNDVPIAEAEQFYIALKDAGVETVLVRYPREGHGIRETAHRVDLMERSIAWYRRHFRQGVTGRPRRQP